MNWAVTSTAHWADCFWEYICTFCKDVQLGSKWYWSNRYHVWLPSPTQCQSPSDCHVMQLTAADLHCIDLYLACACNLYGQTVECGVPMDLNKTCPVFCSKTCPVQSNKGWHQKFSMFFQPKFFRIAQTTLPPSSILNEKTYLHDTNKRCSNKFFISKINFTMGLLQSKQNKNATWCCQWAHLGVCTCDIHYYLKSRF